MKVGKSILWASVLGISASMAQAQKIDDERYKLDDGRLDVALLVKDICQDEDPILHVRGNKALHTFGPALIPSIYDYIVESADSDKEVPYHDYRADLLLIEFGAGGKPYLIEGLRSLKPLIRYTTLSAIRTWSFNENMIREGELKPISGAEFGWLHDADIKTALIQACNDQSDEVQVEALETCAELKIKEVAPIAEKYLGDQKKDRSQRHSVLGVVAAISSLDLIQVIRLASDLMGPGAPDGFGCAISLQEHPTKLGLELLGEMYGIHHWDEDADIDFRKGVVQALFGYLKFDYRPRLAKALKDPNMEVRALGYELLGKADKEAAIPRLLEIARSKDEQLAEGGILGLGYTGSPKAYDILMGLAKGASTKNLTSLVMAFAILQDVRALPFVKKYMDHKDVDLREESRMTFLSLSKLEKKGS